MREDKILQKATRVSPRERASYKFTKSRWDKRRKKWFHLYRIYPPENRPFLPNDEALKTLIGTIPDIRFYKSERFPESDHFYVYGLDKNMFTVRAEAIDRALRRGVLDDVAAMGLRDRYIPPATIEACDIFLSKCEFVNVTWTGKDLIAHTAENYRYQGRLLREGVIFQAFLNLKRMCKYVLPFTYLAAQK